MKTNADKNAKTPPQKRLASFNGLSDRELGALFKTAPIKRLTRGEVLIKEGDLDQTAYVVLDGLIIILKDILGSQEEITTLGEGDWVGEIAFTQKIRRTATAVAKSPTNVMVIDKTILNALDPKTQLFLYKRLNDLAAVRAAELSDRETNLTVKNIHLMEYIESIREKNKIEYQNSEMVKNIIAKVPRLPAFATDLANRLLSENLSPAEVAEKIKEDPALVAQILKTVNSSYYSLKNKVSDIQHAIVLLGFNEIYQLVIAEGLQRTMPNTQAFRELQNHSVAVSHLCFSLAQETRIGRPVEAATIGLLHDLGFGIILLLKERNPKMALLIDVLDPTQIGAILLKTWNLPDVVSQAVEYQCNPEFSPPAKIPLELRINVSLLYMAHLFYDLMNGRPENELPLAFLEEYKELLGCTGLSLKEILQSRLIPALFKKINTYPASFRMLLAKNRPIGPTK